MGCALCLCLMWQVPRPGIPSLRAFPSNRPTVGQLDEIPEKDQFFVTGTGEANALARLGAQGSCQTCIQQPCVPQTTPETHRFYDSAVRGAGSQRGQIIWPSASGQDEAFQSEAQPSGLGLTRIQPKVRPQPSGGQRNRVCSCATSSLRIDHRPQKPVPGPGSLPIKVDS